ncbi:DUF881 domain-containing protein [Georgenia sp. SYP-B2076]|uniref:DUF881 domain-containing protein n=1 Tax=Georgenia sp. SYP-B2076 TaxID=2495881 RepID=UPI000F8CC70B|nr:DUF881 domain-containing protein [Georgenia sp. SYP-B2076]
MSEQPTEKPGDQPATGPDEPTPGPDESGRGAAAGGRRSAWRALLVPRVNATYVVAAVLCASLGFGVVAQVRQTQGDALAGMRQDDLVRLLDELTQRNAELGDERDELRADLSELRSSSDTRQAAEAAAREQARVQGVLAGTLPVSGPGVVLTIRDPQNHVRAQTLVTILEELRNAGAEAIELSGQRITASSWILDDDAHGVVVDGTAISPPYRWVAVGDPETVSVALGIPGGALASVRNAQGVVELQQRDVVEITSVRTLEPPEHATPVPAEGAER